jgi:hypothetical protein
MTLSNILILDSSFRDTSLYPLNTSFQVPVNSPQQSTDYVDTPLIFFRWIASQPTVTGTLISGSSQSVVLSSDFYVGVRNYYVGCTIQFLDSSSDVIESTRVVTYDPQKNVISLEYPIRNSTITSCSSVTISYWDSITDPFHIQVTGYVDGVISEYSHLFLYNQTKNLIFEIAEFDRLGLVTLTQSMGTTYDLSDQFEIRNNALHFKLSVSEYFISIQSYELWDSFYTPVVYVIGEEVYLLPVDPSETVEDPQVYKIRSVNPLTMELVSYGGNYRLGAQYYIVPKSIESAYENCMKLSVVQIAATINALDSAVPNPNNHVLYIGNYRFGSLLYFMYSQFKNWVVVENFDKFVSILLFLHNEGTLLDVFFLTKVIQSNSLNVANSSFPLNPICLKICLETLILPNKYVKGYRQLLSFFPYVIVKLFNSSGANKTRNYAIISNNPTSTVSQFFCPIGNLLNPNIIRFVEVSSNMTQSLQLNPCDDIFFQVCLPDGNILEYEDSILPTFESSQQNLLPTYTLVIENRLGFTVSNTVCAIFSIKSP